MSYDEQAARRVVEERVRWAWATAQAFSRDPHGIATLASEMLRQLPMVVPETPNDE